MVIFHQLHIANVHPLNRLLASLRLQRNCRVGETLERPGNCLGFHSSNLNFLPRMELTQVFPRSFVGLGASHCWQSQKTQENPNRSRGPIAGMQRAILAPAGGITGEEVPSSLPPLGPVFWHLKPCLSRNPLAIHRIHPRDIKQIKLLAA